RHGCRGSTWRDVVDDAVGSTHHWREPYLRTQLCRVVHVWPRVGQEPDELHLFLALDEADEGRKTSRLLVRLEVRLFHTRARAQASEQSDRRYVVAERRYREVEVPDVAHQLRVVAARLRLAAGAVL